TEGGPSSSRIALGVLGRLRYFEVVAWVLRRHKKTSAVDALFGAHGSFERHAIRDGARRDVEDVQNIRIGSMPGDRRRADLVDLVSHVGDDAVLRLSGLFRLFVGVDHAVPSAPVQLALL